MRIVRDVRIGALSADVFLPASDDPAPAVLTVWPYRKDTGISELSSRWFASRGYASVVVDARGCGASDGALRRPFEIDEADDAVEAIEWVANQPWCDGNVGMWGHSYGAIMALRAAARGHPALRAIAPFQCVVDPVHELWHPDGERGGITLLSWGAMTLVQQLLPPLDGTDPDRWKQRLAELEPWLLDLVSMDASRAVDLTSVDVPALVIGGWRDLMCDGTIRAYEALAGPKRLVMGPWAHHVPLDVDLLSVVASWFDRWLRSSDDPGEPPVVLNGRGYDAWPPPSRSLLLQWPGGAVPADATAGGGTWWLGHPGDPAETDPRGLVLDSEPLQHDVLIAGRPSVSSDGFIARICDVAPSGRATFVTYAGGPAFHRFAAGHRIRVVVSGSDFPRRWPSDRAGSLGPVELRLPVVEDGVPVSLPPFSMPEDPGLFLGGDQRFASDRDRVEVADEAAFRTPAGAHVLELRNRVTATADAMVADNGAVVRMSYGEVVEVDVDARLTEEAVWVRGAIRVDGKTIFEREWGRAL